MVCVADFQLLTVKEIRIVIFDGITTNESVNMLEILLRRGFRAVLYQSDYGRYYEDSLVITRESNAMTVPDRDSLAHINLVTAIEKKYKIRFGLAELQ